LPLRGFGSTDCNCESHLFFFRVPPSVEMFRKQIEQTIPNHHGIERIDGIYLGETLILTAVNDI
jgi:hypothetical protein